MEDLVHKLGDRGQRYVIMATDREGKEVKVGFTNRKSGGEVLRFALQHPELTAAWVVDRYPGLERFVDPSRFEAGCRRCLEDVYAGRPSCRYCNYLFPAPAAAR
jgi:hypothetical protein